MRVKKAGPIIIGVHLTAAEKKAMNMEIQRQIAEYDRDNANEIDAMFLWILHSEFGWGHKRLKRIHDRFRPAIDRLCARYEMTDKGDDLWLCTRKLNDYGIDIDKWNSEMELNE